MHSLSESPEISGLLYKKRGGFGKMMPNAWQYRLFIVSRDGVMTYYDTEVTEGKDVFENKMRGRIDLRGVRYELQQEAMEGMPTNYPIIISPFGDEKWKLCAETKEDQGRWWRIFERYLTDKAPGLAAAPPGLGGQSGESRQSQSITYHSEEEESSTPFPSSLASSSRDADRSQDRSRSRSPTLRGMAVGSGMGLRHRSSRSPTASRATGGSGGTHREASSTTTATQSGGSAAPRGGGGSNSSNNAPGLRPGQLNKAGKGKSKRLKTSAPTSMFSQEYAETLLVLLIANLCLYGALSAGSMMETALYVCVLNGVVAHTLSLRHFRLKQQETKTMQLADAAQELADLRVAAAATAATTATAIAAASTVAVSAAASSGNSKGAAADPVAPIGRQRPVPGATFEQSTLEPKLSPDHTWCQADHRQFNVRVGPDYNRYKKKAPSGPALYEAFAVDMFCTNKRVDHAAQRFDIPDQYAGVDSGHPHVPPVFVLQLQIPSEPPTSLFSSSEDGPGWAILLWYRLTEDTLAQLKDMSTASPAVRLFAQWCEKAPTDPAWRGRFKVINSCTNLEELGMPSAITSYNAKPVLIRRTGTIFHDPTPGPHGKRYIEFDIHVHKFANIARQSIHLITSRCGLMYMQIGFVIEGRDNDELPETLFACIAANKPNQDRGEFIFDGDE